PACPLFPYTTLFRSPFDTGLGTRPIDSFGCGRSCFNSSGACRRRLDRAAEINSKPTDFFLPSAGTLLRIWGFIQPPGRNKQWPRSEEHTSELQSREN